MGSGINAAREADLQSGGTGLHADVLDNFKDQLLVVLLKRLAKNGEVNIPVKDVDATGGDLVSFSVCDGAFNFVVSKKS